MVFQKAVALNPPHLTLEVAQRQDHVVLGQDVRVSSRALGIDGSNVSEEKTRGVDVVHQDLIDHETLELAKIGLFGIGLIACAMADPGSESIGQRSSNIAAGDHRAGLAIPGLPAPIVMNHDPHATALSDLDPAASGF